MTRVPWQRVCRKLVKHPYDDTDENRNPELCIAKSFSLKRRIITAVRVRAKALNISMSTYITALIHNDLEQGREAPLSIDASKSTTLSPPSPSPRGVVVPGFDLADE